MLHISFQPVQLLFLGGATLFLLDAILYSLRTMADMGMAYKISSLQALSLFVCANIAMYGLSLCAFWGAYLVGPDCRTARLILLLDLLASLAQVFKGCFLTPMDWQKTIPRTLGATLIATGLALGGRA